MVVLFTVTVSVMRTLNLHHNFFLILLGEAEISYNNKNIPIQDNIQHKYYVLFDSCMFTNVGKVFINFSFSSNFVLF
jgi:hypothetical protein